MINRDKFYKTEEEKNKELLEYRKRHNAYRKSIREFQKSDYYLALNPHGVVNLEDFCIFKVPNHNRYARKLTQQNQFAFKIVTHQWFKDFAKNSHYLSGPLPTKQAIVRELNFTLKWVRKKRKEKKKRAHAKEKQLVKDIYKTKKLVRVLVENQNLFKPDKRKKLLKTLEDLDALDLDLRETQKKLRELKPVEDQIAEFALRGVNSQVFEAFASEITYLGDSKAFNEGWFAIYNQKYDDFIAEEF